MLDEIIILYFTGNEIVVLNEKNVAVASWNSSVSQILAFSIVFGAADPSQWMLMLSIILGRGFYIFLLILIGI